MLHGVVKCVHSECLNIQLVKYMQFDSYRLFFTDTENLFVWVFFFFFACFLVSFFFMSECLPFSAC